MRKKNVPDSLSVRISLLSVSCVASIIRNASVNSAMPILRATKVYFLAFSLPCDWVFKVSSEILKYILGSISDPKARAYAFLTLRTRS